MYNRKVIFIIWLLCISICGTTLLLASSDMSHPDVNMKTFYYILSAPLLVVIHMTIGSRAYLNTPVQIIGTFVFQWLMIAGCMTLFYIKSQISRSIIIPIMCYLFLLLLFGLANLFYHMPFFRFLFS